MRRLKILRQKRKMTQKELAQKAEISQSAIHYIEQGKKSPTIYTLSRLAEALEVDLKDLVS
ncbi:MAG: helix-turn-helix transcriptional regulator [Clostridiales bacterium]